MNKVPRWVFRYVGNKTFDFSSKKKDFLPKNDQIWPKMAFLVNLGQAMQAYSVPCWWVGWWLWRAGCISQDTYLLYCKVLTNHKKHCQYNFLNAIFLWSISSVPVGMTIITLSDMRSVPFCLMDCSVVLLRMLGSIFFPPFSTAQVVSLSSFVLKNSAHIDCRFVALFFLHSVSGRCTTKPSWRSC